jgi:signal transduction histidine kinase/ActR/RegA family two-component response regulator
MVSAPVSIRRYLMLIVLSALLPTGLFAAGLVYFLWDYQQSHRNQEQLERVRALASLVEGEIQSTVARLQVLASDPQLGEGSLEAFHQRLRRQLRQSQDWANLVLMSPEGQVINASMPYGTPLPASVAQPYQQQAFETGNAATSDLFTARVRGVPTVGVAVPVFQEGKVAYVLVAGLMLDYLSARLSSVVPAEGVAGLFDRRLRFIARSRDPQPYIGKPPGELLLAAMKQRPQGVLRSMTREGERTFTAFTRLADGWYIGVATPSAPLDHALARYLGLVGGAWLGMLALGLLLTRFLMARINGSVAAAVETASRLAAGTPAEATVPAVAELATITEAVRTLFQRERQARAQAEAANKTKDDFLAMLGHELRNPLAPITTALQLMRSRGGDSFEQERGIIQRQVQHMVRLVDDLLDVARIARGQIDLKKSTLEIAGIVAEAVETAEPLFRRKRVQLSVSAPPRDLKIEGDAARLVQVLSNLLINSAKFTPEGGHVSVTAFARDGKVEVSVADDGAGMDAADLSTVFELFTQGHQSVDRPHGGLGIGLAIARSLARLHGGDLVASSGGQRKGSTFKLTLPQVDDAFAPSSPAPADGARLAASDERLVLVVDDNVDAAIGLAELLKLWGFRTHVIHDGAAVIAAMRESSPDIVLLDIGLPGLDGYQLVRLIRREPQWRGLCLIALTGYGQARDHESSRQAGFDLHLVKPVDLDKLAEALGVPAAAPATGTAGPQRPGVSETAG